MPGAIRFGYRCFDRILLKGGVQKEISGLGRLWPSDESKVLTLDALSRSRPEFLRKFERRARGNVLSFRSIASIAVFLLGSLEAQTWHPWQSLDSGLQGPPSAVSWGHKRLDVFAVGFHKGGPYNQVWHGWSDGQAWGPGEWFDPKAALDQQGLTAVSWGPGRLDIFTMKGDHTSLFHQWFDGQVWGSEWL